MEKTTMNEDVSPTKNWWFSSHLRFGGCFSSKSGRSPLPPTLHLPRCKSLGRPKKPPWRHQKIPSLPSNAIESTGLPGGAIGDPPKNMFLGSHPKRTLQKIYETDVVDEKKSCFCLKKIWSQSPLIQLLPNKANIARFEKKKSKTSAPRPPKTHYWSSRLLHQNPHCCRWGHHSTSSCFFSKREEGWEKKIGGEKWEINLISKHPSAVAGHVDDVNMMHMHDLWLLSYWHRRGASNMFEATQPSTFNVSTSTWPFLAPFPTSKSSNYPSVKKADGAWFPARKDDISRGHDVILHSILGKTMQDVKHLPVFPPPHMGNDSSQEGSLPTTIFQGRAKSCSWGVRRIPKIIQQPPLVPQHSTTLQHLSVCHFQQVMQDLPSLGIFDGTFFQPISMKQQFARANDGHQTHQQLIITVDCLCCRFYLGKKKTCN